MEHIAEKHGMLPFEENPKKELREIDDEINDLRSAFEDFSNDADYLGQQIRLLLTYCGEKFDQELYEVGPVPKSPEEQATLLMINLAAVDVRNHVYYLTFGPDYEKNKVEYMKNLPTEIKSLADYLGDKKFFSGEKLRKYSRLPDKTSRRLQTIFCLTLTPQLDIVSTSVAAPLQYGALRLSTAAARPTTGGETTHAGPRRNALKSPPQPSEMKTKDERKARSVVSIETLKKFIRKMQIAFPQTTVVFTSEASDVLHKSSVEDIECVFEAREFLIPQSFDELMMKTAHEAATVLPPITKPVRRGKRKASRRRTKHRVMGRKNKCRRRPKKKSSKHGRNAAYVKRIQRNQKYRARRRYGNNFEGSCDEDDIYEEAEDESTFDDHEGDEIDYATDASISESDLPEGERERLYNLDCVADETGLKHMHIDNFVSERDSESDSSEAPHYFDIQNMSTNDSQNLLSNLLPSLLEQGDISISIGSVTPSPEPNPQVQREILAQYDDNTVDSPNSLLEDSDSLNLSTMLSVSPSVSNTPTSERSNPSEKDTCHMDPKESLKDADIFYAFRHSYKCSMLYNFGTYDLDIYCAKSNSDDDFFGKFPLCASLDDQRRFFPLFYAGGYKGSFEDIPHCADYAFFDSLKSN
nr:hypothetical transcript [Hymenolepis microstoma]